MKPLYGASLSLLTDLYQLTMAYGYWKKKMDRREAVFHLFFRKHPFKGSFALAAGLQTAVEYIERLKFDATDLSYLEQLKDPQGLPLFESAFLHYLEKLKFSLDIDAVPEGTPLFPYEPLLRVKGPILQAQLLESPLLAMINFQTLIATKAARVCWAAKPDPVVEFGLRRAQGIDGAISASRAAFIGGCAATSNVLAGKLFDIPVRGTHAHSWIMAFDDEEESFEAFGEVMPRNCIFLIDTYDSIEGVKKAVRVAKKMQERGFRMEGVRLDSGDLTHLSIEIRKILDQAGFPDAKIMASNELDETLIADLKHQGAKIDFWGVGTHLVTGKDQPALDGVYKLSAIQDERGVWQDKIKISESTAKTTHPGILQVRRFFSQGMNVADMLYDTRTRLPQETEAIDFLDPAQRRVFGKGLEWRDLLVPVMREGRSVYAFPSLGEIQKKADRELSSFHPALRRFLYPASYFAGLERSLYETKLSLMKEIQRR